MNHYVFLSLTNSKSSVHLHALYSPALHQGHLHPTGINSSSVYSVLEIMQRWELTDVSEDMLRASLTVRSKHVGGRRRPQDDSTEGERTQSFPCTIRCETVRFRLQKYRNGGQL
jgi:hypothetical protein